MARPSPSRFAPSLVQLEDRLAPATFVVTNTSAGVGSLREAIHLANANPGADSIEFNIPGAGVHTINLASPLPAITGTVAIKGQTQPGFVTVPLIELNGTGAGDGAHGLVVNSSAAGTVIRGLIINRFDGNGIRIQGSNSHVRTCFIGTDNTGTVDQGNNLTGVSVFGGADNVTIGGTTIGFGNLISGNDSNGVTISGVGTTGNKLQGNRIGTDQTGTLALGNLFNGVAILTQTSGNIIGGTVAGARNVISGNVIRGVILSQVTATTVQGNYIGTTATGFAALGNPIGIDILNASGNTIGGTVAGAGNLISGNEEHGVQIDNTSTGNTIKGNTIGLSLTGTFSLGNGIRGVSILGGSANNVIGGAIAAARNVISGNGQNGVSISETGTTGNIVRGNFIGTNAAGTGAVANGDDGVSISDGATGNVVGGTEPGARNVISGNTSTGVLITGAGTDGNTIQGNRIGTDTTGTADLGNLGNGIRIEAGAANNIIGGTVPGARNIISGNDAFGVTITGNSTDGNVVRGNYIGTDKTGTVGLGNFFNGLRIELQASDNIIGGTVPGAGNVISANFGNGLVIADAGTTGNRARGNRIGLAATSSLALGNQLVGVYIGTSASDNVIGGTVAGSGNVIAHNSTGIRIDSGTGNSIQRNRFFDNGSLGIDLGVAFGVTANDLNDPDAGPNDLLNFPELTLARVIPAGLRITGSINAELNSTLRIEFFASAAPDASGYGEGDKYLGFVLVQTLAGNTANFTKTLSSSGVLPGQVVTATATDQAGNTSEFSLALLVV